jgi:TonB family protein
MSLQARVRLFAPVVAVGVALSVSARAEEAPAQLSPGRVALLVLEPPAAASATLVEALKSSDASVRSAAARVLAATSAPIGCEALEAALASEENPEARREDTRGIAALCRNAPSRETPLPRADLVVRVGREGSRPVANRPPLVRSVTDLPRGVALGAAKAAGCGLEVGAIAVVEVKLRPQGTPENVKPLVLPPGSACRKAALALAALSRLPRDLAPPPDATERLVIVFDADALLAADEAPVGAPEPLAIRPGSGGPVAEPKETLRVKPAYPDSLRRLRLEGTAVLTARIDREGRVADLRVIEPAGSLATANRDGTTLDLEAVRAVARWRYEPARLDGEPVPVLLAVAVSWSVSSTGVGPSAPTRR